jgi:hypothetical protein
MTFEWLNNLPINGLGYPVLTFAVIYLIMTYRQSTEVYKEIKQTLTDDNNKLREENDDNRKTLREYEEKIRDAMKKELTSLSEARDGLRSSENHFIKVLSEEKMRHMEEIAQIKASYADKLNELDSDFYKKLDRLDKLTRNAIKTIGDLYSRKIELISESQNADHIDVEKINSAIETLRELSSVTSDLKIKQLDFIQRAESTVRSKEVELNYLVDQISDISSKHLVVAVFGPDVAESVKKNETRYLKSADF